MNKFEGDSIQEGAGDDSILNPHNQAPQIDYFAFQNKIRKLIHQLIQPAVLRAAQDRQHLKDLQVRFEEIVEKQDQIEFVIHKTQKRATLFDQIFSKIANLQKEIKLSRAKEDQDAQNIKAQLKTIQSTVSRHKDQINSFTKQNESVSKEVLKFTELISNDKDAFYKSLHQTNSLFQQKNLQLSNKFTKNSETLQNHHQHLQQNSREFRQLRKLHEALSNQVLRIRNKYEELSNFKLDEVKFIKQFDQLQPKFDDLSYQIGDINSKIDSTDNYIQKYFPIRLQTIISNTLHNTMGKRDRTRLADYQEKRYSELHKIVLGDDGKSKLNKVEYVIPQIQRPSHPPSRQSTFIGSENEMTPTRANELRQALDRHNKDRKSGNRSQKKSQNSRQYSNLADNEKRKSSSGSNKIRNSNISHNSLKRAVTRTVIDSMTEAKEDEQESPVRSPQKKSARSKSSQSKAIMKQRVQAPQEGDSQFEIENMISKRGDPEQNRSIRSGLKSKSVKSQLQSFKGSQIGGRLATNRQSQADVITPREQTRIQSGKRKMQPKKAIKNTQPVFYQDNDSDFKIEIDRQSFSGSQKEDEDKIAKKLARKQKKKPKQKSYIKTDYDQRERSKQQSNNSPEQNQKYNSTGSQQQQQQGQTSELDQDEDPHQLNQQQQQYQSQISNEDYILKIGQFIKRRLIKFDFQVINKRMNNQSSMLKQIIERKMQNLNQIVDS